LKKIEYSTPTMKKKLTPAFIGPFVITSIDVYGNEQLVKIESQFMKKEITCNVCKLEPHKQKEEEKATESVLLIVTHEQEQERKRLLQQIFKTTIMWSHIRSKKMQRKSRSIPNFQGSTFLTSSRLHKILNKLTIISNICRNCTQCRRKTHRKRTTQ